MTGVEALA